MAADFPYPERNQSNPLFPSYSLNIGFNIILTTTPKSGKLSRRLKFLHQSTLCISRLLDSCYMLGPENFITFIICLLTYDSLLLTLILYPVPQETRIFYV
jgi:hypothetical protein